MIIDEEFETEFEGISMVMDLSVQYRISGNYIPATLIDPEEYPEIEVGDITLSEGNKVLPTWLYDHVHENMLDDIEKKCMKDAGLSWVS